MKQCGYERIQEVIRRREESLEIMRKLLNLKLIRKKADLTILMIHYRVCNAVLRAVIKISRLFLSRFHNVT